MSGTFADALKSKGVDLADLEGTAPKLKERERKKFEREVTVEQVLTWRDDSLGTVRLVISGVKVGETTTEGAISWTQVLPTDKVGEELVIHTHVRGARGIMIGHARGKSFQDVTNTPNLVPFVIPIGHRANGSLHTYNRKEDGQNDFRISFTNLETGLVVVLEIGFTEREGLYGIHQQENFVGQIVWLTTPEDRARFDGKLVRTSHEGEEMVATIIPTQPMYAHEQADPYTIFAECDQLIRCAIEHGCSLFLLGDPEALEVQWEPDFPVCDPKNLPTLREKREVKGQWIPAVVLWFNATLGWGFAKTKGGQIVFVHFSALRDWNGVKPTAQKRFPALQNMQLVLLKTELYNEKVRAAVVVPAR